MIDLDRVLTMDLDNLSAAELNWLHDLKNKAAAMQGRLQLKHAKQIEEQEKVA